MHPPPQDPCILRLLARSLPLASPGSPLWFFKVGIVSLQIGLQIGGSASADDEEEEQEEDFLQQTYH